MGFIDDDDDVFYLRENSHPPIYNSLSIQTRRERLRSGTIARLHSTLGNQLIARQELLDASLKPHHLLLK